LSFPKGICVCSLYTISEIAIKVIRPERSEESLYFVFACAGSLQSFSTEIFSKPGASFASSDMSAKTPHHTTQAPQLTTKTPR
jgi:hypothetical protein